jgi:hypothetical protein
MIMTMRSIPSLIILACLTLAACSTVREGVIVAKRSRTELPEVYDLNDIAFRCEPSVYWVEVRGEDAKGRERIRNVILFRHDWEQLRVGDHWSREKGFAPAEAAK